MTLGYLFGLIWHVLFFQAMPYGGIPIGGGAGITQVGTCSDGTCVGGNTETGTSSDHQTAITGTLTVPSTATLLVGGCAGGVIANAWSASDLLANTWHDVNTISTANPSAKLFYAFDKSGSALVTGADTFSCNGGSTSAFPAAVFVAYKGTLTTASVLDIPSDHAASTLSCPQLYNGGANTWATTQANELVVCSVLEYTNAGPYTISGTESYNALGTVPFSSAVNYGVGLAGVIQGSTGNIGTGIWSGAASGTTATQGSTFKHP